MDNDRKKLATQEWKLREPDLGVIALRCTATGETFLTKTTDTKRGFNRHLFQLEAGMHPNRRLQQLWNEHGRDGLELSVAAELECDDPAQNQTKALKELLEACLARTPGAVAL